MGFKTTCVTHYELEWKVKLAEVSHCRASWTSRAAEQTPSRLCRAQASGEMFRGSLSRTGFQAPRKFKIHQANRGCAWGVSSRYSEVTGSSNNFFFFLKLQDFQDFINFCREDTKITGSFFSEWCTTAVKNWWCTRDRVPGLLDRIKSKLPPLWVRDHAAPSLLQSQSAKW